MMGKRFTLTVLFVLSLSAAAFCANDPDEEVKPISDIIMEESLSADSSVVADSVSMQSFDDLFGASLDSMVNDWYVRTAFNLADVAIADECADSSILFKPLPDSVYVARLKDLDSYVELSYNSMVRDIIVQYTVKRRKQVSIMLGLANYYYPIFEATLDKYNLPLELKYLPIIESALNSRAFSRAGACGLWQFIYGTGRKYGLEVDSYVDERCDPEKSTDAAARHLKDLFDIYGDWQLSIAAYNCGMGNVNKAMRRTGGKTFWEIFYYLPRETRSYVPAYIAAVYAMNYYKQHGIVPVQPKFPLVTDTIMVNQYLSLEQVSKQLDLELDMLREINPMYRRCIIPAKEGKPYPLCLPIESINKFIENEEAVFAYERDKYFPNNTLQEPKGASSINSIPDIKGREKVVYTVKSGDNVGFISSWFNVRTADIRYWNNLRGNLIRMGQKLVLYVPTGKADHYKAFDSMSFAQKQEAIGKSAEVHTSANAMESVMDDAYVYYKVRSGDNLWVIANKYPDVSADDIQRLNNISNTQSLKVGQNLKIKRK